MPVNYEILSGEIIISVLWNGILVTSSTLTGSGVYNWNKALNTPTDAVITIESVGVNAADFTINYNCVIGVPITVVKVVL